jgi:hypothetical protein
MNPTSHNAQTIPTAVVIALKRYAPGQWLLTNRPWRQMQDEAISAEILTYSVNQSGFFLDYTNLRSTYLYNAAPLP